MNLFPKQLLYLQQFGDCFIGLDLATGRYTLYRGRAAAVIARCTADDCTMDDLKWLRSRGFHPDQATGIGCCDVPQPRTSLIDDRDPCSLTDIARSVAAQLIARRHLRKHALADVLRRQVGALEHLPVGDLADYRPVAAAFHRSRQLLSQDEQCLVRGIALTRQLQRRGLRALLVFGVKLPFAAHCWVQSGSVVLSDRVDSVQSYRPIFVL